MFDVLYRHKKRSVLEMSQSDEWAACIRQSDWGFFFVRVDLGSPVTRYMFYHGKKTNGDGHERIGH